MAEYLGINIVTEGFLLSLAKMSLQVRQRLHSTACQPALAPPHATAGTFAQKLGNI
jgi:hypothetical protein